MFQLAIIDAIAQRCSTKKLFLKSLQNSHENRFVGNGWVFVYKLSGSGFESSCCHLSKKELCFLDLEKETYILV